MNEHRMSEHRMADPYVRTRAALMLAVMTAIAWMAVTVLGRAGGPYATGELPDLAGLPVLAPQIERLVPPRDAPQGDDANRSPVVRQPATGGAP